MEDEFDSGFDVSESMSDVSDDSGFDVESVMDDAADFSDIEEFTDYDSLGDDSFDVNAIMDEADVPDEPEIIDGVPIEEDYAVEMPDESEIIEDISVEEEVVEDISEEPEMIEDVPTEEKVFEDVPEESEAIEDVPTEEEVFEGVPEEPEVIEDVPAEEEVVEDVPEEPEVIEDVPTEEEVFEDVPEEPEVIEDVPTEEEVVEDVPEELEVIEDIPAEEECDTEDVDSADDTAAQTENSEDAESIEEVHDHSDGTDVNAPVLIAGDTPEINAVADDAIVQNELETEGMETTLPLEQTEVQSDTQTLYPVSSNGDPSGSDDSGSAGGPGLAQTALGEYLAEHNYGRDDYTEYSQDPEWQRLNNEFLIETGREPIDYSQNAGEETTDVGPGPAQTALGEYLAEHNYGRDDYAEYSQDPEWQRLNNEFLAEIGREPIDYSVSENIDAIPATADVVPDRVYDDFEETIRLEQEDFYDSGTFYTQGINEYGFTGTCGETSMASTINRVLGTNEFTENKVLDVAVQEGLCDTGSFGNSGGTTTDQFMELYDGMNDVCGDQLEIERHDFQNVLSMEEVAQRLDAGSTINVAVDSSTLWDQEDPMGNPFPERRATDHWITVTGVQRSEDGTIQGFDIIDSGGGESYVDADKYQAMCYGTDNLELTDPTCIVVSKKEQDTVPELHDAAIVADAVEPVELDAHGPMKPNDCYESNGYTYQTDASGRIISASGELHLDDTQIRNPDAQIMAGGDDRALNDDGGHLIATRFGGSPELDNLVAKNTYINRAEYKRLENAWARDLEAGNRVVVNIKPYYGVDSQRPTHITGDYTVIRPDGSSFKEYFSLTNEDLRSPEFQADYESFGDSDFYQGLSEVDQVAYQEAIAEKAPRLDEGRVFAADALYEDFSKCPEDSDEAFELQRLIHKPVSRRKGGAV